MDNYGRQDTISVMTVKALFDAIDLPRLFRKWGAELVAKVGTMVEELADARVKESCVALMSKNFKDPRRHLP